MKQEWWLYETLIKNKDNIPCAPDNNEHHENSKNLDSNSNYPMEKTYCWVFMLHDRDHGPVRPRELTVYPFP